MAALSPKPFSITFAPSRAKSSAIPWPMPLVEPVITAPLPLSESAILLPFLFLSGLPGSRFQRPGRGAQHFDVRDSVLDVRLRGRGEPEILVEALEAMLRADANRTTGPECIRSAQRFRHEFPTAPCSAQRRKRDDAPDGRLRELDSRGDHAAIGDQHFAAPAQQMPRARIDAVHVLERAILLDHEDLGAQLQEVVDFARRELVEVSESPADHAVALGAAAFARCSHVSTTVSGFNEIDSMPSAMSHSARSG